jgi:hypothetical protein
MVTGTTVTETPPAPADTGPAEAIADWLRGQMWNWATYDDDTTPIKGPFALVYEADRSDEDRAAPPNTVVVRTPDGRYWHATIVVTVVEQVERTWAEAQ